MSDIYFEKNSRFRIKNPTRIPWGGVLGVVAALIPVLGGLVVLMDRTDELREEFINRTTPILEAIESDPAVDASVRVNDGDGFVAAVQAYVAKNGKMVAIENAIGTTTQMLDCKKNYFCFYRGYDSTHQAQVRRFWYAVRPAIIANRGKTLAVDFGEQLETEAARILQEARRAGSLPKP